MLSSFLLSFVHNNLSHIPWAHWTVIGGVSLALILLALSRKRTSVYGSVALGMTVFTGLFLLDALVLVRSLGIVQHATNAGIDLGKEFQSVFHGSVGYRVGMLSNILAFIPFGFFLSGFLASTRRIGACHRIGVATLAGFGLSLGIECLQLLLHVGFFEVTDLLMNTLGAFVGAGVSVGVRSLWNRTWKS